MDKMKLYAVISPLCILFSQGIMPAQATPEDWEGFKKKIQASNLADKEAILEIANSSLAPDDKDLKIRKLHPASYRYILDHIYPRLRHQGLYRHS